MIHRLFLGISFLLAKPDNKLPAKTKEEPNKRLINYFLLPFLATARHWPDNFSWFSLLGGWTNHQSWEAAWGSGGAGREHHHRPHCQTPWVFFSHTSNLKKWTGKLTEEVIPGSPGEDYPIYSSPPDTSFSCDGFSRGLTSQELTCWTITTHHGVIHSSL